MPTDSEILYNSFTKSKKQQRYIWISSLIFLAICFISTLIILAMKWNNVVVVKESGRKVDAFVTTVEKTFEANAKLHLDRSFYYLNTFDRFTEKENRGKALLHIDSRAADRIWTKYNQEGVFADVRAKGVTYKSQIDPKSIEIFGNQEPFQFSFTGIITRVDQGKEIKFKANCSGDMIYYTPVYPQKPTGFFITNITQKLTPYEQNKN